MNILSKSVKDTLNVGRRIAKNLKKGDIVCLFGELGSGKTVLVKGIAEELGIKQNSIISPTFVLLRQYVNSRIPLYHFDLYRLKNVKDIFNLGYEEYLYGQGASIIEWADRLGGLMPQEYLKIELFIKGKNDRLIKITPISQISNQFQTRIGMGRGAR